MGVNPKPDIDWAAIRESYEEGFLALPDIADQHGVAIETIRERADREAWPRLTMDMQSIGMRGATVTERILGISSTRFFDLQQEGVIEPVNGKYHVLKTVRAVVRYFMAAAAGRTPGEFEKLKIETEKEKFRSLELKNAILAGDLVPSKDFEATIKAVFVYLKGEFTDRSAKIAYTLADEHDPGSIKLALERHDRECLERVAARLEDAIRDPQSARELATGGPDTAFAVGREKSPLASVKRGKGIV